ncbi:NAD(P)/FAD-dependent oxidoreductase [Candidatus Saccharibacteria bacterium]|nr:NAD(P)/FAD-dependent oxidoreductase [Candidatus Saccharibacteria bacterium]
MGRFDYDYIVIGSGAAGSAAAMMSASLKKKTAIIEADKWGGSGVNTRDVPFAAALQFAHLYNAAITGAKFGLSTKNLRYNYPAVQRWREVATERAYAKGKQAFEEVGIDCYEARANFVGAHEVAVAPDKVITGAKILIATGVVPDESSVAGTSTVDYLTPADVLTMPQIPKTVLIAGGGASGCEVAEYLAALGSKVVIVEIAGRILPKEDVEVGRAMEAHLEKLGIKVLPQSRAVVIEKDAISKKVVIMRGGQEKALRVDEIVLATGTKPAVEIGLENAGVEMDKDGIKVDKNLHTTTKHIFAAGDVIGGISSTEKAAYDAAIATNNAINKGKAVTDYTGYVRMTDTEPAVATVGLNEDECIKRDLRYISEIAEYGKMFVGNVHDFSGGFVKMIVNKQGKILGCTVMGPEAGVVIQEVAMAMKLNVLVGELATVPHVNSSWSEAVRIVARRLAAQL